MRLTKDLKDNKGITLISLIITIILILIIASTTVNISYERFELNKFKKMKNDIDLLSEKTENYNLKYNGLPILRDSSNNEIIYSYTAIDFNKNVNDNSNYYIIDLAAMEDISLNYGEEGFKNPNTSDDVYIINEETHQIYYVRGIEVQDKIYHSILKGSDISTDNIPSTKPQIKIISGITEIDGTYENKVDVEIIPGKDSISGVARTTYSINSGEELDIKEKLTNNIYTITHPGNYKIKATTYDNAGNASSTEEIINVEKIRKSIKVSSQNSDKLELNQSYAENINNLKIYGTSTGVGDSPNLFDINSVTKFYHTSSGNEITKNTISNGIITNNYGAYSGANHCNSNITKLSAGTYILSSDVLINNTDNRHVRMGLRDINKKSYAPENLYDLYQYVGIWVRIYYTFTLDIDTEIMGFMFYNNRNDSNTLFKNIELRKVTENSYMPNKYAPYKECKIKVNMKNSRNMFNIDSVNSFYYYETSESCRKKSISEKNEIMSYISNGIIYNKSGRVGSWVLCNSNVKKLKAGTYTLSVDIIADKESGGKIGEIGFYDGTSKHCLTYTLSQYKVWERKSYTFTITEDIKVEGFYFIGNEASNENFKFKNIQLEKGSTATEYQENREYEIALKSPLYQGDYIDFKQGKVIRSNGTEEEIELPEIQLYNDYTRIEVITENTPSRIEAEYLGYVD